MIFKTEFKTGVKDIGKDNLIKNRSILEYLENAGTYHSDLAGYGPNDIKRTGVTWILLDWKLQMTNRPKYGETVYIETWAKGINKYFTDRDFKIYNAKHELCGMASSKWALVDTNTGRIARITEDIMKNYESEDIHVFPEGELDKLKEPEECSNYINYTVIRKDIDLNRHMHNLYYLDLAYEALPQDVYFDERPFSNVRISYKKEIKLGDTLVCKYAKVDNKHVVTIKNSDESKIHSIIELY